MKIFSKDKSIALIFDRKKVLGRGKNGTTVFDGFSKDLNTGIKLARAIKRVMKEHHTVDTENTITQEPRKWSKLCRDRSNGIVPLFGYLEDDEFM